MKKIVLIVAALAVACAPANAQGLLEKAKKAVGNKVEGAVSAGLGKIMGGKQESQTQTKTSDKNDSGEFIYTARGVFDKGDDPYKLYVDALEYDPVDREAYEDLTDMGGDNSTFAFKSISEAVAAYPGLPTARQMAISTERQSSSEVLRNYDSGVSSYVSIDMVQQHYELQDAVRKSADSHAADNGAAVQKAVFEGAKKLGKSPEQLTEAEILAILEGMDASPFAAASTATNGDKFDSVTDRISAILDRSVGCTVSVQKAERSLSQFEPISWKDSEAWQQIYDNEQDIDGRIVSYWDNTHKNDYPEFWKEARRAQNAIIDKFNIQQAVKWRKILQAELEPNVALLQEIADADAELESLVTDRSLIDYSIAKQQINSAFNIVSQAVVTITKYAYSVPLVSNTIEDGYGQ